MFNNKLSKNLILASIISLALAGCSVGGKNNQDHVAISDAKKVTKQKINQKPTPIKLTKNGTDVYVEMTAQVTNINITKTLTYNAWTYNGEAPGPLVVVNEGDTIHFKLKNMDPTRSHSMDFHAVHAAPDKKFSEVNPNHEGNYTYTASNPGVFMYHCGSHPTLGHIANGMGGVIIVKPKNGYPTDSEVDKEFVIIQNEWYKEGDFQNMRDGEPSQVVFSTKALKKGDQNTNGDTFTLKEKPLTAKVGDKVRLYVDNVGPNHTSSFHVVGTVFDDVYIDGNPYNRMKGLQTVLLPASGGAVVEFTLKEEGTYSIVTHQFNDADKGAIAKIKAIK
ncbi:multicopper oxidase domain-containing protein [Cytobacillus sp. Hz8]|uniref:multicopper oxidase domain-containing protein n=1 Tax=Cytobacillus sp. Hz8 TaxID=3347168 RepID=UPI0035DF2A22